ncbi:MAG: VWA domain-containing protein [Planctomycetota bacterium]|nr:VWA domain-containing protein [Planctomycetota bacterium]
MITEFEFGRLQDMVHLLWTGVLVLLACAWGVARRRRVLETFGIDRRRHGEWLSSCTRRRWLRATVLVLSLLLLTAAAVQPRCNPEKTRFKRQARDVAILLDVSRSMLADDLKPSRLKRAQLELEKLCDHLTGDRLALIAFAGDAVIKCPLTSDYSYVKSTIKNISPLSASQGGTSIGDAVRKALKDLFGVAPSVARDDAVKPGETVLESEARAEAEKSYASILLITDGEDHRSYPKRAAEWAAENDVTILAVGLGSEKGTPIPIQGENGLIAHLKYQGEVVRSKLDSKTLQEMALITPRGAYLPAGVDNFDLVDFYDKTIGRQKRREVTEEQVSWTEIFQPFLLAGIILYFFYLLLPERPPRQAAVRLVEESSA